MLAPGGLSSAQNVLFSVLRWLEQYAPFVGQGVVALDTTQEGSNVTPP